MAKSSQLRGFVRLSALPSVVLALSQCSLALKPSAEQCASNGDCAALGAEFEGTYCDPEVGVCRSSLDYCRTNQECIDRNGGQPFICHQDTNTCASLLSSNCTELFAEPGDVENDDTVFMGLTALPSVNATWAGQHRAVDLARREFKTVGFLPGVQGGPRRPLVFVTCDPPPPRDHDRLTEMTLHLTDSVRVSGILGPTTSGENQDLLETTITKKVVLFAANSTVDTLSDVPGRTNYFFRLRPTDALTQGVNLRVIDGYIEPKLREEPNALVPATTPLKLAHVRSSTVLGSSASEVMLAELRFNGKSASDNYSDGNYKEFNYGDSGAPDFATTSAQAITALLDYVPHVITINAEPGIVIYLMDLIEKQWPTGVQKPIWWAGSGIAQATTPPVVKANPDLIRRTAIAIDLAFLFDPTSTYNTWVLTYEGVFGPSEEAPANPLAARMYDMTYMLFYAVAALGDEPLTGESLGPAYRRIADPQGIEIKAGVQDINKALGALANGQNLKYVGVTHTPLWNEVGDNIGQTALMIGCLDPENQVGLGDSGLRVAEDGSIVGTVTTCLTIKP